MLADVPDFSVESVFLRIFRQMKKSSRKIKEVMQMNIFETVKAAVTVRCEFPYKSRVIPT